MIRIGRVWFPVISLGYGNRLGVWFQGCGKDCRNCISPEFRDRDDGSVCLVEDILGVIEQEAQVDGLTVSGGEPFDQPEGLLELVMAYKEQVNDDILVFTGYSLEELHQQKSETIENILQNIAVLVDGRYVDEMNDGAGLRGSANQNIYIWKQKDRHADLETAARTVQCVFMDDYLWMIGIPPR